MTIRFLDAGCGDAIHICFEGDDKKKHNILIDGGTEKGNIYEQTLQKTISDIYDRKEQIDLWVITHIDDDHIGGILRCIRDRSLTGIIDWSKCEVWFNYAPYDYDTGLGKTSLKSVRQGILLRDFLRGNTNLKESITNGQKAINVYGLALTPLSPDHDSFLNQLERWKKEEIKIKKRKSSEHNGSKSSDYTIKIEDFDLTAFSEDSSPENRSSIALLIKHNHHQILLTADSHPSVICEALRKAGYGSLPEKRLRLSLMQIPHHGSKGNFSNELLQLVDCQNFVIAANGINKHNLPNKETLARIIRIKPDQPLNFYLTQANQRTKSIFTVDELPPQIQVFFADNITRSLNFNFD